jgi:outer membrane lipoprotein carrier protein
VLILSHGPTLAGEELPSILEGIRNKYRHLPGLTVTYTREVITRTMSMLGHQVKGDLATGLIYFAPPHFLRLEQETPEPETLIANGDSIWWYVPKQERAYRYSSQKCGKEFRLLSDVFQGLGKAEESFHIVMAGSNEHNEYQIELRPDPPWQEIDRIVLTVTSDYDIRIVDIYNQLGGLTRLELGPFTTKEKFDKGFFQFIVPEGVQVVKEE